jgi:hypothetical protein
MSEAFAKRLRRVCDTHEREELRTYGRQALIARTMNVSEETVRKWFAGLMAPRPDKARKLAKFLGVDEVWLILGRDPDVEAKDQRVLARHSSGAVMYVRGLLQLAGAVTADPTPRDPRGKYVDFYAVVDGQNLAIHAPYGRETDDGYLVPVPAEHHELRVLPALPYRANYLVLDMPTDMIDRHAFRKAGNMAVTVQRAEGGGFISGQDEWPRLRPGSLPAP